MFVAAAIKLTPEVEQRLLELQDSGAFGESKTDFIRELLKLHQTTSKPTALEIARQADLSAQTVHQLAFKVETDEGPQSTSNYASVFLSYGGPDEAFARRLYEGLLGRGVETFFFPESATPGERLHRTMSDGIHEYDRVLLLCSRSSLKRPGVLNELEQVLAREAREDGTELLMPVLLDDFVLAEWAPSRGDLARQLRDRVAADFRDVSTQPQFTRQFNRVLKALRVISR